MYEFFIPHGKKKKKSVSGSHFRSLLARVFTFLQILLQKKKTILNADGMFGSVILL